MNENVGMRVTPNVSLFYSYARGARLAYKDVTALPIEANHNQTRSTFKKHLSHPGGERLLATEYL